MRNPVWERDELILALDLYMKGGRRTLSATSEGIVKLSALLGSLPLHPEEVRGENFRNPTGVSMKVANFVSLDPLHGGDKGLKNAGSRDRQVWDEFHENPALLSETAASIAEVAKSTVPWSPGHPAEKGPPVVGEEDFPEGRLLTRLHVYKERSTRAVARKKNNVFEKTGRLACEACRFDFAKTYKKLGEKFAECHHTKPVSGLRAGHRTKLGDLAIVCSNCHRMIHKSRPMLTIEELKSIIEGK